MDRQTLQKLVNRISAGKVRISDFFIRGKPKTLIVCSPTSDIRSAADDIYCDILAESEMSGTYSSTECVDLAIEFGLWDNDREKRLEKIPNDIQEMKVLIYQHFLKPSEVGPIRRNLRAAETIYSELLAQKHSLDMLSSEAIARKIREHFILSRTVFLDQLDKPLFSRSFWQDRVSDSLMLYLFNMMLRQNILEKDFRYIARHEPWRSIWMAGKEEGRIFGVAAAEMTDDQRNLICWSKLYDNIQECPDRPTEDIIADDDALDGWMIYTNRQRAAERKTNNGVFSKNEKIKNSGEVYIIAKGEDIGSINSLNSEEAIKIKRQREAFLKKQGEVLEQDLPDIKRDLTMKMNKMAMESIKRKGT